MFNRPSKGKHRHHQSLRKAVSNGNITGETVHKQLLFFRLESRHDHSVQMQLTGSWQGPQVKAKESGESVTVGCEAVGMR